MNCISTLENTLKISVASVDEEILAQMHGLLGAGDGRVEPLVLVLRRLERDVARHLDKHRLPFSSLSLVASDGIAIVATKRIEIGVFTHRFFEIFRSPFGVYPSSLHP